MKEKEHVAKPATQGKSEVAVKLEATTTVSGVDQEPAAKGTLKEPKTDAVLCCLRMFNISNNKITVLQVRKK